MPELFRDRFGSEDYKENWSLEEDLPQTMLVVREPPQHEEMVVIVLPPCLAFLVVEVLFLFVYGDQQAVVLVLTVMTAILSFIFLAMGIWSKRSSYTVSASLCLANIIAAMAVGLYLNVAYLERYGELEAARVFTDVDPTVAGNYTSPAAVLHFEDGTFVDEKRTLGFMARGSIYCVAPVVSEGQPDAVQYWAYGKDCCEPRVDFDCGVSREPGAKTGLLEAPHGIFRRAIRQAKSVYGITSAGAALVSFPANVAQVATDLRQEASLLGLAAIAVDISVCVLTWFAFSKMPMPEPRNPVPVIKSL